jgi:hypothetical protein
MMVADVPQASAFFEGEGGLKGRRPCGSAWQGDCAGLVNHRGADHSHAVDRRVVPRTEIHDEQRNAANNRYNGGDCHRYFGFGFGVTLQRTVSRVVGS